MKKRFIVFGLLAFSFFSYGQKKADTVYKKQKVSQTEVQALFSYYTQDGDHSAITGGIGTENLQVYAPQVNVTHTRDSVNTYSFNGGVDIVTSASHDNIDFVMSSVSRVDARTHMNAGYSRHFKKMNSDIGINTGFSLESAYFSIPVALSYHHANKDLSRELNISLQCYFDDLRWGRLARDLGYPKDLVYPYELRYKDWFDIYRRNSYNLSFVVSQVINARTIFAIYPELVYQQGLLSTPFHRVYFINGDEKVENLPRERWKAPIGLQLNRFAGGRTIVKAKYRFYWDTYGILAHTLQLETAIKLNPQFTLAPSARFYTQSAANDFRPYAAHDITEQYYTSDYDLSKFNSYELGLSFRYAPHARMWRKYFFKEMEMRYAYYKRSDALAAHMLSVLFSLDHSSERL